MKFRNKEDYEKQRNALLAKAENLIAEGNIEGANAIIDTEIPQLDNAYTAYSEAMANFRAMQGAPRPQMPIMDNFGMIAADDDVYSSMEYRRAFMNHVMNGAAIPQKFVNADQNTKTSDAGAVIPTTTMERIIEKLEDAGKLYNLVTKTAYKGGVSVPTSTAKPTASWLSEGAKGDRQKKVVGSITFGYHKLKCSVSISLEMSVMALSVFENTIVNNVSTAMIKAIENGILNGTGSGEPKGILKETPPTGQAIEVASAGKLTYSLLCDAEAALPEAYENGAVWVMSKKTFMKFIGMVDDSKQPIARTNYGLGGKPERALLGRPVICTEHMPTYTDSVTADTIFAAIFKFDDYLLNSNLEMTIKSFEDNDTDDTVTKAIMIVDGKTVDTNSLVTLTKKKASS